jgi:hypothetical protein
MAIMRNLYNKNENEMKESIGRVEFFESSIKVIRTNIEKESTLTESKLAALGEIVFKPDLTDKKIMEANEFLIGILHRELKKMQKKVFSSLQ